MMHRAWSSIVEVPYCFSRSYIKFQGHTVLKIVEFDPNWAFPDCNSSLNSMMAMKCCTKLETAKERCPIVFEGHPSNFKVTRDKISPILTQIGHFQTIGRSQLSNPSDLPCSCVYHFGFQDIIKDQAFSHFGIHSGWAKGCGSVQGHEDILYVTASWPRLQNNAEVEPHIINGVLLQDVLCLSVLGLPGPRSTVSAVFSVMSISYYKNSMVVRQSYLYLWLPTLVRHHHSL